MQKYYCWEGDRISRGQVVHWEWDANSNPIDRSNQNPILDTHVFAVEFPGEEITELAANIIAKLMCTQCDFDSNEYLLLEVFVNH